VNVAIGSPADNGIGIVAAFVAKQIARTVAPRSEIVKTPARPPEIQFVGLGVHSGIGDGVGTIGFAESYRAPMIEKLRVTQASALKVGDQIR